MRTKAAIFLFALLASFALLLGGARASSAADVRATVDRTTIDSTQTIVLTVSIQDGGGKVDTAPLEKGGQFRIGGTGSSTNLSIVNGKMIRTETLQYRLLPLKSGKLTIPALTVTAGSEILRTQAIEITVRNAGEAMDAPSSAPGNAPGNAPVLLQATLSNSAPYVGEQLLYVLKVFLATEIANAQLDLPDFTGMDTEELEERKRYQSTVAGREFTVIEVRTLLTPLQAGATTFPAPVLQCDVVRRVRRNTGSPFDSFFGSTQLESRVFHGNEVSLNARELPTYTGEAPYTGLIGNFDIQASLDTATLAAGQSATLAVAVSGRGNIMDAPAPKPVLPEQIKHYVDQPEQDVSLADDGYTGKKVFRYALVPLEAGQYAIPPLQLAYFDTERKDYVLRSTDGFTLIVTPAAQEEKAVVATPETGRPTPQAKQEVGFAHKDLLPLKEGLAALQDRRPLSAMAFGLLLLAPVAAFAGLWLLARLRGRGPSTARQLANRAQGSLQRAQELTSSDPAEALSFCAKALVAAVRARTGRPGEALTYEEAEALLAEAGADEVLRRDAATLLRRLDEARYGGPGVDAVAHDLLAATRELTRRLLP